MAFEKMARDYQCGCSETPFCNCQRKDTNALFLENIDDVAKSLVEVMMICGIHQCKAKGAMDVIKSAFLHYDEVRHRIDTMPYKRLCKEDLINDLGRKCMMTRLEAQIVYSIMKRAFSAFYFGTCENGIRNPLVEAQLIHCQECHWVHAAIRTAQIFANYEGMFYSAQKIYAYKISCVYKALFERMKERSDPLNVKICDCKDCKMVVQALNERASQEPKVVLETGSATTCATETDNAKNKKKKKEKKKLVKLQSYTSLHLPQCGKCKCPKLVCDCDIELDTGILSAECSQGPFVCRWVRDDDEDKSDPCILLPEEHQCPVDCFGSESSCDSECECDCDPCECCAEDMSSDYEDYEDEELPIDDSDIEDDDDSEYTPAIVDMTPMRYRVPTAKYAGCRVPPQYLLEDMSSNNSQMEVLQEQIRHMADSSPKLTSKMFTESPTSKSPSLLIQPAIDDIGESTLVRGSITKPPIKAKSNVKRLSAPKRPIAPLTTKLNNTPAKIEKPPNPESEAVVRNILGNFL